MKVHGPSIAARAQPASHGIPRGAVVQSQPARSISHLAQNALASSTTQTEGADDVALTLGHRLRAAHQPGARPERVNPRAARRALADLIGNLGSTLDSSLSGVIEECSVLEGDGLHARLAAADLPPGAAALVFAALAGRSASGSARRRYFDDMLDAQLADDDWQLNLLSWIEFGGGASVALPELKLLYQSAMQPDQPLAAWFKELRGLADRRRKLRALIRALGFSLSADGEVLEGEHLAAVVTDLKRLLIFFGMEEQCAQLAACMPMPRPQADDVFAMLLEMIDESWIYEGWLQERFRTLRVNVKISPRFAYRLRRLVQALPEPCFREDEQREQIVEALESLIDDDYADEEEGVR